MPKLRLSAALLPLALASTAPAQQLRWSEFAGAASGNGKLCVLNPQVPASNNVFVNATGPYLNVIFANTGIAMESGVPIPGNSPCPNQGLGLGIGHGTLLNRNAKPESSCSVCVLRAKVEVPKGYYIASLGQQASVGAVKDPFARALVSSTGSLGQFPLNHVQFRFRVRSDVLGTFEGSDTHDFKKFGIRLQCALTKLRAAQMPFQLRVDILGQRQNVNQAVLVNMHNSDFSFDLQPQLEACPKD